jgi:riboflavin synthase
MFTGLVEAMGRVANIEHKGPDARLRIDIAGLGFDDVAEGDSIAVNGVCLTAVAATAGVFEADVSAETLSLTTLSGLGPGTPVNLERSLTPESRMGGHFVTGHVDGVAECLEREPQGESIRFVFELPRALPRYVARKGSIAVDGVSLTVNTVKGTRFEVNIVPHTLEVTTLDACREGTRVNIEVDLIARYLERLMGLGGDPAAEGLAPERLADSSPGKPGT